MLYGNLINIELEILLAHYENPSLEFQVKNVLPAKNEAKGNYLYCCVLIDKSNDEAEKEYNYHESDLSFIRQATKKDLEIILEKAVEDENYEFVEIIKNQIINL
tara:strand:- start:21812 stop:22123 length:312 start_codon:yes stop_codon:yes gene_type:complete